ncbi:hypothetical protein [Streptomyces sp. NPDC097619]|uniref:hypothetical protein n=1 Tax=Streptomyces sp. NPDC097619 TaxID=3157228 RepID=UPI003324D4D7
MTDPRPPLRTVRAAMFAAVCTTLAAVGHSHMSGHDLPIGVLLGAFAVTTAVAGAAAGRRRGPLSIGAALLAAQGVLHLLFARVERAPGGGTGTAAAGGGPAHAGHAGHGGTAPAPPHSDLAAGTGHGGMSHAAPHSDMSHAAPHLDLSHGTAALPDTAGMTDMAGMAGMAGHGGTFGMIAVHVLAALFCALWLARGEAAVFRLARALRSLGVLAGRPLLRALALVGAAVPAPPRRAPRPRTRRRRPHRLRGAVPAHALVRRGPPTLLVPSTTAPGRPACA